MSFPSETPSAAATSVLRSDHVPEVRLRRQEQERDRPRDDEQGETEVHQASARHQPCPPRWVVTPTNVITRAVATTARATPTTASRSLTAWSARSSRTGR